MPPQSSPRSQKTPTRLLALISALVVALTATLTLAPAAQADRGIHVVFEFERTSVSAGDPLRGSLHGFDAYDREALASADLVLRNAANPSGAAWDVDADGNFTVDTTDLAGTVTLELINATRDRWLAEHTVVVDTTPWTPALTVTAPEVALGEESVVTVRVEDPLRRIDDEVQIWIHGDERRVRFVDGVAQARFTKTPGDWLVHVELPARGARQEAIVQESHLVQGHETNFELTGPKYGAVGQVFSLDAIHDTDLTVGETMSLDTEICTVDGLTVTLISTGDCIVRAELAIGHDTWHPSVAYFGTAVGAVATTLEVTSSPTPFGSDARVTARVLVDGKPVPAVGSIAITVGDYSVNRWTEDGTATFEVSDLALGTHDVQMEYRPSPTDFAGSFGSTVATVVAAPTNVLVTTTGSVLVGNDAEVHLQVRARGDDAALSGTFTITSGAFRTEQVTTDGTATVLVPSDSVGDQPINVTFTPSSPNWTNGTGHTVVEVLPHETWLDVDAPATAEVGDGKEITVAVGTDSERTVSGTVTLRVGRTTLTRSVADSRATFSLQGVPTGTHQIQATFTPDGNDFTASTSTTTTLRMNPVPLPRITARIVAANPITASGWYRNRVTVAFTCSVPRAPLTNPCPTPVTLGHGRHAAIERTITTTTGQRASVRVPAINVDIKAPQIKASLLTSLTATAHLDAPKTPKCVASDSTSGVATCTITSVVKSGKVTWTATATDRAGNRSTRTASTTLVKARIKDAKIVSGTTQAKAGKTHVLEVRASNRPTLKGHAFTKVNKNTWRTNVKFTAAQAGKTLTLKPKAGKTTFTVKVKVIR